jgi:hypothetical protein
MHEPKVEVVDAEVLERCVKLLFNIVGVMRVVP